LTRWFPAVLLPFLLGAAIAGCGSSGTKPAATVNGHDISMASYNQEFQYDCVNAASQYGFSVCANRGTKYLADSLKKTSLEALIQRELIQEYAAKHHISVSALDFNRYWAIIYRTKFGSQTILKAFAKSYKMTVADLKTRIRGDLLKQKVEAAITNNMPAQTEAIRLARLQTSNKSENRIVLNLLHAGDTFRQIAVRLDAGTSAPCKAAACGDLGWIPVAFLPPNESNLATARVGS
jgi:hypothetical protein